MPRTKPDVPSIGSITQRHGESCDAGQAVLLAERGVLGPCRREAIDDQPLRVAIDLGHLCGVLLPVDREVTIDEMGERVRVDLVGDVERQRQLGRQIPAADAAIHQSFVPNVR